jgi:hypothetical protein
MFSRFSLYQQRDLERFLGIVPECNFGRCDKPPVQIDNLPSLPHERDIAYRYHYNPQTGDMEYSLP